MKYYCCITKKEIPQLRVDVLLEMGVPPEKMTCLEVAEKLVKKRKGMPFGKDGTEGMFICDRVDPFSSVRAVFQSESDDLQVEDSF